MPAAITLISRILLSPIWLLWRSYLVLWWAFNEEPSALGTPSLRDGRTQDSHVNAPASEAPSVSESRGTQGLPGPRTQRAAQDAAFEIIDTRPAAPQTKPIGALKGGFTISLIAGALLALAFSYAAKHDVIAPSARLPLWLWSSCMVFVGSLWPVRHIARRQLASQPKGFRAHTVCVAGGVKDCGVSAFTTAKQVKNTTVSAGRRVHVAASTVADGAKRLWGRMPRRTA